MIILNADLSQKKNLRRLLILKHGVTAVRQLKFEPEDQTSNFSAVTGSPFRCVQVQCMFNKRTTRSHISAQIFKFHWQKYSLKSQSHNLLLLSSSRHCYTKNSIRQ